MLNVSSARQISSKQFLFQKTKYLLKVNIGKQVKLQTVADLSVITDPKQIVG